MDGLHRRRGYWQYRMKIDGVVKQISTRTTDYREMKISQSRAIIHNGGRRRG